MSSSTHTGTHVCGGIVHVKEHRDADRGVANATPRPSLKTNKTFLPFIAEFKKQMNKYSKGRSPLSIEDIPITFGGTTSDAWAGLCKTYGDGKKSITIKRNSWNRYPRTNKEALIFHEFGHCLLDRGHDSRMITENMPRSYMYPSVYLYGAGYGMNRDYYLDELFNPPSKNDLDECENGQIDECFRLGHAAHKKSDFSTARFYYGKSEM